MSLMPLRSIASFLGLALAAAVISASCGGSEPTSPIAPSALSSTSFAAGSGSARVTTSADEPEPGDAEGEDPKPEPAPGPEPGPEPGPVPGPAPIPAPLPGPDSGIPNPNTDPGAFPAPPLLPGARGPIYWTPSNHRLVRLRINPDPVPFSGVLVPLASCRDLVYTWYYEQVIHAETGIRFTLTERENYFDGRLVSRTPENINVDGNGTARINSRWCSAFANAHTAQHRFKGRDENGNEIIVNGPLVRLQQNPSYVPPPPVAAPAARSSSQRARETGLTVWGD